MLDAEEFSFPVSSPGCAVVTACVASMMKTKAHPAFSHCGLAWPSSASDAGPGVGRAHVEAPEVPGGWGKKSFSLGLESISH